MEQKYIKLDGNSDKKWEGQSKFINKFDEKGAPDLNANQLLCEYIRYELTPIIHNINKITHKTLLRSQSKIKIHC